MSEKTDDRKTDDKNTDSRKGFECNACGAELAQYQHFCDDCGTFSRESFDADDRPPGCEFFENDRRCGEDSDWYVFRGSSITPMCDDHLNKTRENYRGKVEFYPVDHEGEGYSCDCCGRGFGTHGAARDCCAADENSLHLIESEGDRITICGLRTAAVAWQTVAEYRNYEQSDNFDPNPFCHTCIGERDQS